jgi:glycerol uptake operon antiterminator
MLENSKPHLIEIMPGIASKIIRRFTDSNIPVIAGGLIETKQEVTEALKNGAEAISTGKQEIWYI